MRVSPSHENSSHKYLNLFINLHNFTKNILVNKYFTNLLSLEFASCLMAADIPVEEAKAQLLTIQKASVQNTKCIDCGAPSPTWASPMYGSKFTLLATDESLSVCSVAERIDPSGSISPL
jgi:hypothetical protein